MANFLLIGFSAAIGAWLRWLIGAGVITIFPGMPFGALTVNLLGGFLMGLSIAFFQVTANISEELRLIINVGFLGGLTTFSAYTADLFQLMDQPPVGGRSSLQTMTQVRPWAGSRVRPLNGIIS